VLDTRSHYSDSTDDNLEELVATLHELTAEDLKSLVASRTMCEFWSILNAETSELLYMLRACGRHRRVSLSRPLRRRRRQTAGLAFCASFLFEKSLSESA
jgi:hypothetical protein